MPRPVRALPFFGVIALVVLLAAGACTTEFITEGGNCEVDDDCETGEVCRGVVGAAGGEPTGVCLRACDDDGDCVGARDEVCRLDPDGVSGVCGRICVVDSDCSGGQLCRFDQCVDPMTLVDQASIDPPVDAEVGDDAGPDAQPTDGAAGDDAAVDGAVDALPADALPADALPADALPADALPADAAPDGASGDMLPNDAAPDMAPADMQPVDAAPDMAP